MSIDIDTSMSSLIIVYPEVFWGELCWIVDYGSGIRSFKTSGHAYQVAGLILAGRGGRIVFRTPDYEYIEIVDEIHFTVLVLSH
jgi:hypothetical protein